MRKLTEIIPDDLPEWAVKAMAEGQLFNVTFKTISEQKQRIAMLETLLWRVEPFIDLTMDNADLVASNIESVLKKEAKT